jgi:hypothetical protein
VGRKKRQSVKVDTTKKDTHQKGELKNCFSYDDEDEDKELSPEFSYIGIID